MLMTMVVIIVVVVAVDMMCEVVVTNGVDRYMKMFCFVFEILLHLNLVMKHNRLLTPHVFYFTKRYASAIVANPHPVVACDSTMNRFLNAWKTNSHRVR